MSYPRIVLHKGKEISLLRLHPWIFSGAIASKEGEPEEGGLVDVFSANNKFLGTGYYANGSIAVRIISFEKAEANVDFWTKKISRAWDYRRQLGILNDQTNVCRIFFGEGDGAPGLILDYYDGHVIMQAHALGIHLQRKIIAEALQQVPGMDVRSIFDKSAETLPKQLLREEPNSYLFGSAPGEIIIRENGHQFKVDIVKGQKTGFFIDQRENRQLLSNYCKGRQVLNTFSYTGGFSVYAGAAGATRVVSVDSSEPAIALCESNMQLNSLQNHEALAVDAFDYLKDSKQQFDVIVLDPPAFAKSRDSKHQAIQGYKRLNAMALKAIRPGGILFTFSCSGVIDKFLFYNTITSAAIENRRNIRILRFLNQPADHPVSPYFPEGEYLKGLVLWVE